MDIQYAILGLLNGQPLSGYDLKKIIAESDLFYWSGNNNQIYNSLVHLHKQGLVTQQVQYQESLPAKKIYTITEQGRNELRHWLLSDPELPELRSSFLIQLALAGALSPEQLDLLLGKYEEEVSIQLRMRQAQAARMPAHPSHSPRQQYLWEKISANMTGIYQYELDWVREVRKGLRDMDLNPRD